ncbi:S8 family serine peptidase [Paenibacillus taiwanensis]|uniref:S8 family serine peptidase n=1 Tax=Paenibacillus taiwanensis TaxID=401638 RepID=UPI000688BCB2|nr:S8 family serine peptidase [Paenibacillus taiwanensis]
MERRKEIIVFAFNPTYSITLVYSLLLAFSFLIAFDFETIVLGTKIRNDYKGEITIIHTYSRFKKALSIALASTLILSLGTLPNLAHASESGLSFPTNTSFSNTSTPTFEEKIVVKIKQQAFLPSKEGKLQLQQELSPLSAVPQLSFEPLISEQLLPSANKGIAANHFASVFDRYYYSKIPAGADIEQLLQKLRSVSLVEEAYLSKKPELANAPIPNTTPVLPGDDPRFSLQNYAQAAPLGINAPYAWQFEGGDGKGIKWADVEWNWALNHEDLVAHNIQLLPGGTNDGDASHGTAVVGVVSAVDNAIGNIGLANKATPIVSSLVRSGGTAEAILAATQVLSPGDVILLEIQIGYGGPWLPIETQPAEFDAIQYATSLGIVVVEAGANGGADLDQYKHWDNKYIFNRDLPDFKDSGAILVGAGSSTVPHYRLGFSSHGNRIDAYGIGENVATLSATSTASTTGYTDYFNGTSSASPVVVGAIVQLQGIAKAKFGVPYSPAEIRRILRWLPFNTPTADIANDRIGMLPNLKQIITNLPTPGAVPNDTTAPLAPTNLVVNTTSGTVNLNWTASTDNVGLIGYDIYVNNDPFTKARSTSNSATISGLPNGSYTFTVKARDGFSNLSTASNSVTVQVQVDPCPAPWSASSTYVQDNIVTYNGVKYQAKWWTQNDRPDLKSGPNDVWTVLGPC